MRSQASTSSSPSRILLSGLAVGLAASAVVGFLLAARLAFAPGGPGLTALVGSLPLATFWIAAAVNLTFAAVAVGAALLLGAVSARHLAPGRFVLSGVLALNVAWMLWNRLAMSHQWLSVRPFLNTAGVVENLGLALLVLVVWAGVYALLVRRRTALGALGVGLAAVLALGLLEMNRRGEARTEPYSLDRIRSVVGTQPAPASSQGPVLVLGIDGLSWNVLVPLFEAGELPHLRRLAASGTVGYLRNGDESLSPRIWTSIYSGRPPGDHRIQGFVKMRLPDGTALTELLLMRPSLDTFYGLKHLLERLPSLGLWELRPVGSSDRRVPTLWEVASGYGRDVVVVNPLMNLPLDPVRGAIVDLRQPLSSGPSAYQPPSLAERWGREPVPAAHGTEEGYRQRRARLGEEVAFFLELLQEQDPALGVYYTHFLDTTAHMNWDFYARDRFFLPGRDEALDGRSWEEFVVDHRDDRVFDVYRQVDREVGRIVEAFPEATFLIVSDHGWTFFGYEHFGSPDGVLIGRGGPFRAGEELASFGILDVMPTVLALLDLPLSRELDGAPVAGLDGTKVVDRYPAHRVQGEGTDADVSEEEMERLRAIGYVD